MFKGKKIVDRHRPSHNSTIAILPNPLVCHRTLPLKNSIALGKFKYYFSMLRHATQGSAGIKHV
jgi:hypothetical protein